MNSQQTIAEIQADANRPIAEIRQAEQALAATMAADAMSEEQRAEQERRQAEIAAAVDQWQSERLPALMAEFDQLAADVEALRIKHQMAVELLRTIPTAHNALARQIADAIEQAVKERLSLPDAGRNKVAIENELRARLVDGRDLRIAVDSYLKQIWSARGWFVSPLVFD